MTIAPSIYLADDAPRVRRTDPSTSHEAADGNNIHGARAEVLFLLAAEPLADHQIHELHTADCVWESRRPYTPQRLRTARNELVETGQVEFAGIYRLTPNGGKSRVWSLA